MTSLQCCAHSRMVSSTPAEGSSLTAALLATNQVFKNPKHPQTKQIVILICVQVGGDLLGESGVSCALAIASLLAALPPLVPRDICSPSAGAEVTGLLGAQHSWNMVQARCLH